MKYIGRTKMIDVSKKDDVLRVATAEGWIKLKEETIKAIVENRIEKGDVLTTANVAAILAIKKTPELIPMCHPIPITSVDVSFKVKNEKIGVACTVKSIGKTGVEMEALTGVSVALLTIWDMVKSVEKDETGNYPFTAVEAIKVVEKRKTEN
jgi:cyclic pyranopterin phosphate synthase